MVFAIVILIIAIILAIVLSHRQPTKMKYIIWGITTILVIAPLLSWLAGILFAINVGDGFAGMLIMIYGFILIAIVGIALLLKGLSMKKRR